jgi:ACS family hexuronate transporter-like MFS transporter
MSAPRPLVPIPAQSSLILGLVFSAGLLNYFDRQTLSILKATLKIELGLTDTYYSYLVAAFMVPYIAMYLVSGRIVDRFGSRRPMTFFIAAWSVATAAAGLIHNIWQLAVARAALGAAEPGVFPAGMRAQMRWFPVERRAFLMSLNSPCTAVGAILAPPAVALLTVHWGWRSAFVVPGMVGLGLAALWWLVDRPEESTHVSGGEGAGAWRSLFASSRFRGLVVARVITDPVWYFFLFWMPGYMQERVGLTLGQLGAVGWIPSAVAAVVGILSARWSDKAAQGSPDPAMVRVKFLIGLSLAAPASLLVHSATSLPVIIALLCVIYTVGQLWFLYTAILLADIVPSAAVGGALGILGAVGATVAMLVNLGIGPLVETLGYGPVFIGAAVLHPVGSIVQWWFFRRPRTSD